MAGDERRIHSRLPLELPLEVHWRDDGGEPHSLRAVTRDVSTGGLYFETEGVRLPGGAIINIDLTLPTGSGIAAVEGRARSECVVTRVVMLPPQGAGGSPDRYGFAVRFRHPLELRY